MKLTEGKIWKRILIFYFPLLMSSLLQQLYNAADAVVVGKYIGKEALSAVGGTTSILCGHRSIYRNRIGKYGYSW